MISLRLWVGVMALVLGSTLGVIAQSLTEAQLRSIPVPARRAYQEAMQDFDHMNPEGGLRTLAEAAEMSPGTLVLQEMVAERALELARGADTPEAAQEWVDIGRTACQRITESPSATESQRAMAQETTAALEASVADVGVRIERRREGYEQYIVGRQGLHPFQGVRSDGAGGEDGSSGGGSSSGGAGRVIRIRNASRFMEETASSDPVLVDFCAEWCHVCESLEPIIRDYARTHGVKVLSVDIDDNPDLASTHNVSVVPTLVLYQNGGIVRQMTGAPLSVDGLAGFVGR